jgi:hypothetical protein
VSDGLPDEIWSYLFRPPPAWGWSIEPDFNPDGPTTPLLERDFPSAAKAAFVFLEGLGFDLTAADAWDVSDDAITIAWERADALVLATLADDGSFFALIGPRPDDDDNTPTRARLSALTGERGAVAAFGSLPVLGASPEAVARTIAAYVEVLRDRVAPLLTDRPVDFEKLTVATDAAIEEISRPRLIAYYRERAEAAWNDSRFESFLEAAEQLEELGVGLDDAKRIATAKARRRPTLSLGDGQLDEATRIRRAIELVEDKQSRLNEAIEERHEGREAWSRWEDAAREWHEAMALLYPKDFWDGLERLRIGDPAAIEPAITFLEVDPWCFRSGYAKETILRFLKRADLNDEQAGRLRTVILNAVDVGDRREFRGYCKLAIHVLDDGLRLALLERLRSANRGHARRALWVLDALREPLGPDDRATAQAVLENAATDTEWWRVSVWVRPYVGRYGDIEWIDRLLTRAVADGRDRRSALRLLSAVRVAPSEEQRRVLGSLVLREIPRGEDEDWLESTAVLADSPGFRGELIEAYNAASDSDERRRAWWAINAIRRSARDGWPGDDLTR